jgi:hypothetical protein
MSSISNPASPGSPTQVTAEQPIRSIGGIPFSNHTTNPAVAGWPVSRPGWPVSANDAHVAPVPSAIVDALSGRTR